MCDVVEAPSTDFAADDQVESTTAINSSSHQNRWQLIRISITKESYFR